MKSRIKNSTEVTSKLSSTIGRDSNNENILLLTNTQVSKPRKAFAMGWSANMKLTVGKIGQSGGFQVRLLGLLSKAGVPLMKNVFQPLAKSVLIPLRLTAATSATDAVIHKKMFESDTITLIISNNKWMIPWKYLSPLKNLVYL